MRRGGFSLIEFVAIVVIVGILAAVALPRIDTGAFRALEFHDRAVAALRFAQKSATSHRRLVCVEFTATTVALAIATAHDHAAAACNATLAVPGTPGTVTSGDSRHAAFDPVPAALYFQPDGRGTLDGAGADVANVTLRIAGMADIVVAGTTGYVE